MSRFYAHTTDLNMNGIFTLQAPGNDCGVSAGQTDLTNTGQIAYPTYRAATNDFNFTLNLDQSTLSGNRTLCYIFTGALAGKYNTIGYINVTAGRSMMP